jgi:hypothetical protein
MVRLGASDMIPRKLHQVWVGPRPVPSEWIGPWWAMHPKWDYRLWRDEDLADFPMLNRAAYDYYRAKANWVGMCDIARMAILREQGGVYVDVDSRPLRTFEGAPFMAASFFAGYEPVPSLPGRIAAGTIGAEAGHPIFATLAHLIEEMPNIDEVWDTTGGTGLTAAILAHRQCCNPLVLPARTFYATDASGRPTPGTEVAYSEHFWATTNKAYPVKTVILVPRRADGGRRDALWEFTWKHWEVLGWPIVDGHHEEGPFNASAARNAAARLAGEWDVAVFVDADTIMLDHEPVRRAVKLAAQSGQFVRPYQRYWMTDENGAGSLMTTRQRPASGVRLLRGTDAHGGVNVVPRRLWDALGGYDERFRGWGSEDAAFELAARVLGGFQQLPGEVFHLWHPISADRSTGDPGFQANVALRRRYEAARRPSTMRALLAERSGGPPLPPAVGAVIITDGRRDCIARTIPSLEAMVGPFADRLICDDSGDPAYARWLTATFPTWRVRAHQRVGHGPAVAFAMAEAAKMDADWVWWSEDDILYQRQVDLAAMARLMETEGDDLKQISLKRQAWFPLELAAGPTVIDRFDPALFTERTSPDGPWLEHRQFFTLNPHLIRRDLLRVIRWPSVPNSEHHFGRRLFANPLPRCGIWGARSDAPWIAHFGERTGMGY